MHIDLLFTPVATNELYFRDKNVVVIDVLRASTSIVTALKNGAREVIPVESVENAVKVSGSLFGDVVLRCGEREGKTIPGFNLGNSPDEYTIDAVQNKSLIFTSTNGSLAMVKAKFARQIIIAAFVNMSTVVDHLTSLNEDFVILCAGREHLFCIEDAVCGGMIIHNIEKNNIEIQGTDAAVAARVLYKNFNRSIHKMLRNSEHGQYLISIGFESDLKACAAVDSVPVLPVYEKGVIKLKKFGTSISDETKETNR
jgi:2-phosphosulfolactate phosphatase